MFPSPQYSSNIYYSKQIEQDWPKMFKVCHKSVKTKIAKIWVPIRVGTVCNSESLIDHMITNDLKAEELVLCDVSISTDHFRTFGFLHTHFNENNVLKK